MRRSVVLFGAFLLLLSATWAFPQYQSCIYCDVMALNPDPFPVHPCDTMTMIFSGDGYQSTNVNGCDVVPVVDVRSRRPDRVNILAFRVLDDDSIEVDIEVPCNASAGLVGIDVLIDDDTTDAIPAYACGNLRFSVEPVQSCDYCALLNLPPTPIDVDPCDTGTITITGAGFLDPSVNNCFGTPTVSVVSLNPGRLVIVTFRVLNDGTIEVDYRVPCNATPGQARIQILIDDNPSDGVAPLDCGEARLSVNDISTAVSLLSFTAERSGGTVDVRWTTLSETDTLLYNVYRERAGAASPEIVNVQAIPARGAVSSGAAYAVSDRYDAGWSDVRYYLVETETSGKENRYGPAVLAVPGDRSVSRSRGAGRR